MCSAERNPAVYSYELLESVEAQRSEAHAFVLPQNVVGCEIQSRQKCFELVEAVERRHQSRQIIDVHPKLRDSVTI